MIGEPVCKTLLKVYGDCIHLTVKDSVRGIFSQEKNW